MRTPRASMLAMALIAALGASCDSRATAPDDPSTYRYQVPEVTGDGWKTASAGAVGLDESGLVRLMSDLQETEEHQLHSILVARYGSLVFEEYFPGRKFSLAQYTGGLGFGPQDTHNLASVTKSFTTTLVGIAIDQGSIRSVHAPVFDFFPEHADLVAQDPRRAEMTVEHLLLMTSGIEWSDLEEYSYSDPRNDLVQMFNSDDPIRYALSRDLYTDPGTDFEYCNANTNLLGEIVRRATGSRLDRYSETHLFQPLGVTDFEWQFLPNSVVFASGDLRLRPRDMAKFGQLFLDMGRWGDQEVVSRAWVETATERLVVPDGDHAWADGYGYGWWHWDLQAGGTIHRSYQASGWGGQWIVVIPEQDLVVVSTGGSYHQPEPMPMNRILTEYILPGLS